MKLEEDATPGTKMDTRIELVRVTPYSNGRTKRNRVVLQRSWDDLIFLESAVGREAVFLETIRSG